MIKTYEKKKLLDKADEVYNFILEENIDAAELTTLDLTKDLNRIRDLLKVSKGD